MLLVSWKNEWYKNNTKLLEDNLYMLYLDMQDIAYINSINLYFASSFTLQM